MVVCIDPTGTIYIVLAGMTNNITGSMFLTTLVISLLMITLALGLRIPIEVSMIMLLPWHLVLLACLGSNWLAITGTILIYLGIILGKNILFK